MATVEASIDVGQPVRTVYNQWTQFQEFPRFMEGVEQVVQLDDTHLHWVAEIGGAHREWSAEIVCQLPDERVAWRSTTGPSNAGEVTFEAVDPTTTRVTLRLDFEPEGVVETAGEKLGIVDKQAEKDLQRFKDFIESRGVETGAWRGEIGT
jgi:uncharacterized membrane protein